MNIEEKDGVREKNSEIKTIQDLLDYTIGPLGRWQLNIFIMTSAVRLLSGWSLMSILFFTPSTTFYCVKMADDFEHITIENSTCYTECLEYEYDRSVFENSFITEFDLICDRRWMASFIQTMLMLGTLIGFTGFGWIADRFGRRFVSICSIVLYLSSSLVSCFTRDYAALVFLRFILGVSTAGILNITMIILIESIHSKYIEFLGCATNIPILLAIAVLPAFAYFLREWNTLLLGLTITSFFCMPLIFLIPETPRWLITMGKHDEAVVTLKKIAKRNKHFEPIDLDMKVKEVMNNSKIDTSSKKSTYLDLFRTKRMSINSISTFAMGLMSGVCYFGLYQYMSYIVKDVFISVTIVALVQIVGVFPAYLLNRYFGRKSTTISTLLVSGLAMIILTFISNDHVMSFVLSIIGIVCVTCTLTTSYIYFGELFPTAVRNMGMGFGNAGIRIGGMIAPFVASIQSEWIPSLIFAILPLIAIAFCFLLPETKGKELQDRVEG